MKKFWSLMLVALVMLGAAACTENNENVDATPEAGVSFYAKVVSDNTRAYIDDADGDKIWETIWESGDILEVSVDGTKMFNFTYDGEKFTCNEPGVTELLGQTVTITSRYQDRNSYAGKRGWGINGTQVENFAAGSTATFEAYTSFFRYTYNGDGAVTFTVKVAGENPPYVFQDGNLNFFEDITISDVKGENFIPFWTQNTEPVTATLSYSIDGVKCKETELALSVGKVYNLGTLADPTKVYLVANVWNTDNAWFAAYFFDAEGNYNPVTMTAATTEGVYECAVPAGMESVIFCRMNPEFTEFGWNVTDEEENIVEHHVWNKTGDLAIGVDPDNYYYIHDWSVGVWGTKDGYEVPTPTANWYIAGTHNEWNTTATPMNLVGDYYVAYGVEFTADGQFKVVGNDMWLGVDNYALGTWMTVSTGAGDIYVTAGTYDIYYSESENKVCVVAAGAEVPAMPVFSVGIVGFGGDWNTDVNMTLEGDYYTLKNVAIAETDKFKIRISGSWDENYGIASSEEGVETIAINADTMYTLALNGKNMQVAAGTYDLYFNYSNKEFYVLTEGTTPDDLDIPQYKIYVYQYNNTWDTLNLYTWDDSDAKHTGNWPGTPTTTTETINDYEYKVWTMPRVATSKHLSLILNDGNTMQTDDFTLGTLDKDYYLLLNSTNVSFIEDKENPEPKAPVTGETSDIGVVGSFQGWDVANPVAMITTADGWIVASGVELYKSDEFKFVKGNTWDVNYGNKDAVLVAEVDTEYTLSTNNPQNIKATKNGKFDIYFNTTTLAFKYECVEEYTDLTVDITIDNKANWSPLYITLKNGDTTVVDNVKVTNNKYALSGDYIGESLSYILSNGSKTSEGNITITKDGVTINLEETIIKLTVQLNTDNSKQWWGDTMKIHVWNTGTSFDTSWPGVAMTSEGNYTWSINVPSELVGKTINYLVHNGNGWQSSDSTVTIKAEGNTVTGSSIGIN